MSEEDVVEFNKVVMVGESGVGKTCIISRYIEDKFDPGCVTSLSTQFFRKVVTFSDGRKVTLDLYDTAGQEKYRSIARLYYKNARVVIMVYDITSQKSFDQLKGYWYEQVKDIDVKDLILAVVANKNDLYEEREVEDEVGEEFANQIGAIFGSTSAKEDSGVTALFDNIGRKILDPSFDYIEEKKKKNKEYKKNKEKENKENRESNAIKNNKGSKGDTKEFKMQETKSFRITTKTVKEAIDESYRIQCFKFQKKILDKKKLKEKEEMWAKSYQKFLEKSREKKTKIENPKSLKNYLTNQGTMNKIYITQEATYQTESYDMTELINTTENNNQETVENTNTSVNNQNIKLNTETNFKDLMKSKSEAVGHSHLLPIKPSGLKPLNKNDMFIYFKFNLK